MDENKKPEEIKTAEGETLNTDEDNRHEIYKSYLNTMVASLSIMFASFITYYYPMYRYSTKAVDLINSDPEIALSGLTSKDALMYGSYVQKVVRYDDYHIYWYILWMNMTYFLIIISAVVVEIVYSRLFEDKCLYSDLTLEFKYLDPELDDEKKILELFSKISAANVKELSLVYDMSDYFRIRDQVKLAEEELVKKPTSQALQYKFEMYTSKMDHFKAHFKKYKNAYFQNRGFVTFKTFKVACNVNDIYCKAIKDDKQDPLYMLFSFFKKKIEKKVKIQTESAAKRKFRSVVMNKILKPKIQKAEEGAKDRGKEGEEELSHVISKAADLLSGAADTKMKQRIKLMQETVGEKFRISRGIPSEDINWSYRPELRFDPQILFPLFFAVFIILPYFEYLFCYLWYELAMRKYKGHARTNFDFVKDNFYLIMMVVVDKTAYFIIGKVFTKERFLKKSIMIALKFATTNCYLIFSNLLALTVGLVQAGNEHMYEESDLNTKYGVIKQLVDSFYFTYYLLMISNIVTHIILPVFSYVVRGKKTERDISFGLSFLTTCIFYIAFFSPFNANIIPIVCFTVSIMVIGEILLYKFGIVEPTQICFSVIANFFTVLFVGLVPISFSSLMTLRDNHMGIMSIKVGSGQTFANILVIFGIASYLVAGVVFATLFANDRFLKRVQARIWDINYKKGYIEPKGQSYKELNPVYNEIF